MVDSENECFWLKNWLLLIHTLHTVYCNNIADGFISEYYFEKKKGFYILSITNLDLYHTYVKN